MIKCVFDNTVKFLPFQWQKLFIKYEKSKYIIQLLKTEINKILQCLWNDKNIF